MSKSNQYLIIGLLWGISARQVDGWAMTAFAVFSSVAFIQFLIYTFLQD